MSVVLGSTGSRRTRSDRRVCRSQDRGSSTIENIILMPALLGLMFLGWEGALAYQARSVYMAAAQQAARTAASQAGTIEAGTASAASFASKASSAVHLTEVSGSSDGTTVTFTVSGTFDGVIPGFAPTIRQSASMPVERISG